MRDIMRLALFLAIAFTLFGCGLITVGHLLTNWLYRRKQRRWPELAKLEATAPTPEQWMEEVAVQRAADEADDLDALLRESIAAPPLYDQDADSENQPE